MLSGVRLRVVPLESILPHEIPDPGREARIEQRIAEDGMLRDPLLVGALDDVEDYILLDGTNRRVALERLLLPLALVQVIDYADPGAIDLWTWCHSAPVSADDLAVRARGIHGIEITALSPLAAQDALSGRDAIAVIVDPHRRFLVSSPAIGAERIDGLRSFVKLYEHHMTRVDCNHNAIEEHARTLSSGEATALVAFPPLTRSQVVAMAMDGLRIPAGITRHVILGGRALRVNLPLDVLGLGDSAQANEVLARHVEALHPRVYREPTVLYDS